MNGYLFSCEKNNDKYVYDDFQAYFISKDESHHYSKIHIGQNIYIKEAVLEEIDTLVEQIQREWFLFQSIALYDNILSYNEMICDCPVQKERYKKKILQELQFISNGIIGLDKMRNDFIIKLSSWKDNDVRNPLYQYFHTLLELEYYLLFSSYICGASECATGSIIEKIMTNFIHLSKTNYQRQTGQVFVCPCMKNVWLFIQIFIEKTRAGGDFFWKLFNEKLESEEAMFSLWLLAGIAELQLLNGNMEFEGRLCLRIRPNYDLLHSKLKVLLLNADSHMLMKLLEVINPLLTNYWLKSAKVEVYQTIWDFYSKRLNISKKNYMNSTVLDLNKALNYILTSPEQCKEDFEKFVGILICHLREYPNHWGKMKGRIYSQLGPHKLKDLNEVGILHVMFLFSSLSSLNYEELLKKIISLLGDLPPEKRKIPLIWNIWIAFIIQQVKRGLPVDKTGPILVSWIQEASLDHKNFHLLKILISNFEHILNFSTNMQLHQWIFLNSWLAKYLSNCYHQDMVFTFEMLLITLEKVDNPDSWSYWSPTFREYVYPVLKQATYTHNAPGTVGKIAGKLYLVTAHHQTEIFSYFTGDNIPFKIASNFLTTTLGDNSNTFILNSQQEVSVIQTWMKICLLSSESTSSLTKIVTKMDHFQENLRLHLNSSEDPVKALIEYLGSDLKTHMKSNSINKLCDVSFGSVDKWLPQYLAHPENESVVLKIYLCLSLALLHCGPLLYQKNKSSSPLTRLMQSLLLSSDFLIGKTPHEYVLNAIKKTWHIFYEALVKLKDDSDMFLERTLRDMITKYMPHFSTTDSPILKCVQNEVTADVVLEKISNSYFKHPVKESDSNLQKVIKILSETVESTTSASLLRLVVTKTVCGLFELVIFHPQRSLSISLIKVITMSPLYPQVATEFATCIISTTERHLSFNAINYFQMMYIIAKLVPSDVKNLIGKITRQVANVERLRGVGYDINLRSQLEKLENIVKGPQ